MSGSSAPTVSVSRAIVLAVPNPPKDIPLRWMPKSPGTSQDYSLDVTAWAQDAGETVSSFTAMVSVAGSYLSPLVAKAQTLLPNNVCTVLLAGGISVTDCAVTFNISTPTRTLQLTCWIVVSMLSATTDRYGSRAVIGSALDLATAGQITALGQATAAETAARAAEDSSLAGSIAELAGMISDLSAGTETSAGSLTAVASNLHDFQQSIVTAVQTLQANPSTGGSGITSAEVSQSGSLILNLSTGGTLDAGNVVGPTPNLTVSSSAGTSSSVAISGSGPNYDLAFTLQTGETGETGVPGPPILQNLLTMLGAWNASTNTPPLVSSVGTANTAYFVTTSGSTTLNGNSTWAVNDVAAFVGGAWLRLTGYAAAAAVASLQTASLTLTGGGSLSTSPYSPPFAWADASGYVAGFIDATGGFNFGSLSVSGTTSLSGTAAIAGGLQYAGGPYPWQVADANGFIGLALNANSTLLAASASIPNFTTPTTMPAGSAVGGITVASSDVYDFAISDPSGYLIYAVVDGVVLGASTGDSSGGSSTATYSAQEIADRNSRALALSAQVGAERNTTSARDYWNINHVIEYGQSLSVGNQGWPALPPSIYGSFDNLMMGLSMRPVSTSGTVWAPYGGSSAFTALATTCDDNGVQLIHPRLRP